MAGDDAEDGGLAGRTLGDYRLIARLHDGATAELYRAEDARLGRAVAVKVLKAGADEQAVARFVEAARRMASLDHGNVVRVLASGEPGCAPHVGQACCSTSSASGRSVAKGC